ncbi:alpha/beta hydrolase [Rhodococcus olei]|uniref:Alpha/beta hydrolase n=1 Tax=Rhodococcus olei TaxID=2161675 RepID=A0ABP8PK17_9NOCA
MPESIGGNPFWELSFDRDGDVDGVAAQTLTAEAGEAGITDLVVFSHGWNNDRAVARRLYDNWLGLLAPQLGDDRRVGFVGVLWPSELWSDGPIPDFEPAPATDAGGPSGWDDGGASLDTRATVPAGDPALDAAQLAVLGSLFPAGRSELQRIAELLATPPDPGAVGEMLALLRSFALATSSGFDDGESGADAGALPGMLGADADPATVFEDFVTALSECGVEVDAEGVGGAAGLGDALRGVWNGAKEALRQLTYWQMKNRAGVVGLRGLGPLVGDVHDRLPGVRVHLVGHSFGCRVVSFALAGLPDTADPSPVKSVTLLQPAFSAFAFADRLPFDPARGGALAGSTARVDGPLTVCFSSHDDALGVLYPIASAVSGCDAAAAEDRRTRWSALGAVGAYGAPTEVLGGVGADYPFAAGGLLNVDASAVVAHGRPPAGAHSDIVHPELTWVLVRAGRLGAALPA